MKKLLNIIIASLVLVGCTTFDTYEPAPTGTIPSITIEVDALTVTDSTFNLVLTPSAGTTYYSFFIEANSDTITVDGYNLIKGSTYKGVLAKVLNVTKDATFSSNMRNADGVPLCVPNTTYQIYAVASNSNGVVGEVAQLTIKTTDGLIPVPVTALGDAATKSVKVTFSEIIKRGSGKVTATYYKEFDVANPTVVELAESNIEIDGKVVTITAPDSPDGAFVNINWEAAAFNDVFGNPCNAYTNKGFNINTGAHQGIRFRVATVSFEVNDSCFVSPTVGGSFVDWTAFQGVVTFEENIYRVVSKVKTGDLSVVYSSATKATTVQLTASKWSVAGASINFVLPEAPTVGDGVTLNIKAGVFFDVYGNPNAAYTKTAVKWTLFEFKKEMLIGTFSFSGVSVYDGKTYDEDDSFTLEEDTGNANSIKIKDFMVPVAADIYGTYDLTAGKFYLNAWDSLGVITLGATTYEMYLYNHVNTTSATIPFDIKTDGTIVSTQFALIIYNPITAGLSFYDKYNPATFSPVVPASVKKSAARVKSPKTSFNETHFKQITDKKVIEAFHKMK
ncbi:MAG: hypothetical protein Q7J05_05405 [Paludibacter sp.]|nr:hypothetical protein [Paludibacter sp.]